MSRSRTGKSRICRNRRDRSRMNRNIRGRSRRSRYRRGSFTGLPLISSIETPGGAVGR